MTTGTESPSGPRGDGQAATDFQLAELHLPVTPRDDAVGRGLAFDLLSSTETKVVTGHDNGVITLDLAEADNEHRERLRQQLDEPYRTLLGHFRHEIGHYYWPILVDQPGVLGACRELFGDDRIDYALAVKRHYETSGEVAGAWAETHISRYATMHPYEDWAETFAHYLHILDTLQTADNLGLAPPPVPCRRVGPIRKGGATRTLTPARRDHRQLAGAVLCPEPGQPVHGARRPLSVRPRPEGHREARFRRPPRPGLKAPPEDGERPVVP